MPIPTPDQAFIHNMARTLVIELCSLIPVGGWAVAGILDAVLPTDNSQDPLTLLEQQVDQLAEAIENDTWLRTLKQDLNKLQADLELVQEAGDPTAPNFAPDSNWRTQFAQLYTHAYEDYDSFVDPKEAGIEGAYQTPQPQNTLIYMVAYASIYLGVLIERIVHYDQIYPPDAPATQKAVEPQSVSIQSQSVSTGSQPLPVPPPIKTPTGSRPTPPGPYNSWSRAVSDLTNHIFQDRLAAIKWRLDQISITQNTSNQVSQPGTMNSGKRTWYTVSDAYKTYPSRDFDDQGQAEMWCKYMLWQETNAEGGYASNLDKQIDAWRYFQPMDPTNPYGLQAGWLYYYTGFASGVAFASTPYHVTANGVTTTGNNENSVFEDMGNTDSPDPMKSIQVWWDGGALKGLHCVYDPLDLGMHGTTAAATSTYTLQPGEIITVVGGSTGDWVNSFFFNTNTRVSQNLPTLGNQAGSVSWQIPDPIPRPAGVGNDGLCGIFGLTDGDKIFRLRFLWRRWSDNIANLPAEWQSWPPPEPALPAYKYQKFL